MTRQLASYMRVSTQRQGQSGLGFEAQREASTSFLNAGDWKQLQEFQEVESGKSTKTRPVLRESLAYRYKHKATLVVARLDRMARSVAFIVNQRPICLIRQTQSLCTFIANPRTDSWRLEGAACMASSDVEEYAPRSSARMWLGIPA